MRTTLIAVLVSIAVIAFFFGIIGVFGILPALSTLFLYLAIACVLWVRPQRFDDGP